MVYKNLSPDEKILEIARISAVLGDNISDVLYRYFQSRGAGYIAAIEKIAEIACLFFKEKYEIDWSDGELVWDDEVILFGEGFYRQLIEEGF